MNTSFEVRADEGLTSFGKKVVTFLGLSAAGVFAYGALDARSANENESRKLNELGVDPIICNKPDVNGSPIGQTNFFKLRKDETLQSAIELLKSKGHKDIRILRSDEGTFLFACGNQVNE